MGNSFWILFAALNNLKPLNLTIAEVNVFSYSLCETVCPLHYGVINRHWALDVTEKCLRVVWSHVLFPPRKCNTRCANLFFAPGNLQNRTWAPNWNRALKPTTEERPSEGRFSVAGLRAQFQFEAHVLFWRSLGTKKRLTHLVLHFLGGNRTWDHTTFKHFSVTSRAWCPFRTP